MMKRWLQWIDSLSEQLWQRLQNNSLTRWLDRQWHSLQHNWPPQWLTRQPPLLYCRGQVESADEIPDKLPKNTAVIVGSATQPKWIAFDCPCRSGHRIMLNLDRGRSPFWQLSTVDGPLSLSPSVNYYDGRRRCHYFVRNGKVDWMGDTFGE